MSRVDAYLAALSRSFVATGELVPWPVHLGEVMPYCSDIEAADIYDRFRRLCSDNQPADLFCELFATTSSPKTLLPELLLGMKFAGIPSDQRTRFTELIFDSWMTQEPSGSFVTDSHHRVLKDPVAQQLLEEPGWVHRDDPTGPAIMAEVLRLSASAKALVYSLFFYGWTDIGFVSHGPYVVRDRNDEPACLLVRDYVDLHPSDLWPDLPSLPFDSISLSTNFPPEVGVQIDMFNHVHAEKPLATSARSVRVSIDGRVLYDVEELRMITGCLLDQIRHQQLVLERMDRAAIVGKFIENRYYAFRGWRTYFGDKWQPPVEVWQRLQDWDPIIIDQQNGLDIPLFIDAVDPRTDTTL